MQNKCGRHTHTEYQMLGRKAAGFYPRDGSCPHPSYRRADVHSREDRNPEVYQSWKRSQIVLILVLFFHITEVWKIN